MIPSTLSDALRRPSEPIWEGEVLLPRGQLIHVRPAHSIAPPQAATPQREGPWGCLLPEFARGAWAHITEPMERTRAPTCPHQ